MDEQTPEHVKKLQELLSMGISVVDLRQIGGELKTESPVALKHAVFWGKCQIGAFTFFSSGLFQGVETGRYCSFSNGVNMEGDHPTDWLTTHPFPYKGLSHFNFIDRCREFQITPGLTTWPPDSVATTRIGHDVWVGRNARAGRENSDRSLSENVVPIC